MMDFAQEIKSYQTCCLFLWMDFLWVYKVAVKRPCQV